jgi:hypothetical protein
MNCILTRIIDKLVSAGFKFTLQAWDRGSDVWCLGAMLLEFNLESYMWDSHCIEKVLIFYFWACRSVEVEL